MMLHVMVVIVIKVLLQIWMENFGGIILMNLQSMSMMMMDMVMSILFIVKIQQHLLLKKH